MLRRFHAAAIAIALIAATAAARVVSAQQPLPAPPLPQSTAPAISTLSAAEQADVAAAWTLIAQGRFGDAAVTAQRLASAHPRSTAVLLLGVEAAAGGTSALSALDFYEQWLGARTMEEPGALRVVAHASLAEAARQATDPVVRLEALKALVRDGSVEAAQLLFAAASAGKVGELRALASVGNPDAVDRIVARMKAISGPKVTEIMTLRESHSLRAAPALIEVLADPLPENRRSAAEALGVLGAKEAVPRLLPLLQDPKVQFSAAGALYRLGNYSGEALLKGPDGAQSPHASVRRSAALLLASRPDEAWKALVRGLLTHADPSFRLDAARLLAPYEPETSAPVLAILARDPNVELRDEASLALVELPSTPILTLRQMLRGGTPRVKVGAADRLLALTR
jgi:HEAT repeat protein